MFARFEDTPLAAASIAQVHRAALLDGREVIVKVRRPDIGARIDRDMGLLLRLARLAERLAPRVRRQQPVALVEEIWAHLRAETDFRREARNVERFARAFAESGTIEVPKVMPEYTHEAVVQELSAGRPLREAFGQPEGPRFARALVDAYLEQIFVLGVFHADPHPGNVFVLADGRLCLHDFGIAGTLERRARRALAALLQAIVLEDSDALIDAAIVLGMLQTPRDRAALAAALEELLEEFLALPLQSWSVGELLLRIARSGECADFRIPHRLMALIRALAIVESDVRGLDPGFNVVETLIGRAPEVSRRARTVPGGAGAHEAARPARSGRTRIAMLRL